MVTNPGKFWFSVPSPYNSHEPIDGRTNTGLPVCSAGQACASAGIGLEKLSAVVNTALAEHVERLGRLATLRHLLDQWEAQAGPVPPEVRADAAAAFDEAEAGPGMAAG